MIYNAHSVVQKNDVYHAYLGSPFGMNSCCASVHDPVSALLISVHGHVNFCF